MKGIKFT